MRTCHIASAMLALRLFCPALDAQQDPAAELKARFQKREYQIPMRDGTRLFTAVYIPRDTSRSYPILLSRTPYSVGPYGPDAYPRRLGPAVGFSALGYIFVTQDVRGRYRSEGRFVHMTPYRPNKSGPTDVDETTDTWDTIDWLVKNVRPNNGRVGLWGISYPGFFATMGLIDAHPALKAVSPQAPQADWFLGDDTHHNGAFLLASVFNFMAACGMETGDGSSQCRKPFDLGTDDGYRFFLDLGPLANADTRYFKGRSPGWTMMMEHGSYDTFWRDRSVLPHLSGIKPAVLTVGGLYDANNYYGAVEVFKAIDRLSPTTRNAIVIGPWSHGQWSRDAGAKLGILEFGSSTSELYRDSMLIPFFEHHLKGIGSGAMPKARVFETGANRWRSFDVWPPKEAVGRSLYFGADGSLSFEKSRTGPEAADQYVSDPANPVPSVGKLSTEMDPDYMAQDQRFVMGRPDVLVYQGDRLTEAVTIAGTVAPELYVSTTGTDGDWIVKLIDVHPDGTQELVRGDVMRAKFRNSFETPEPMTPGEVTKVGFSMPDVLHTFRPGHRIMVHVQSSWFPLVDRNPQTFVDIYHAGASDFRSATQQIHRGGDHGSRIRIDVLPGNPIP